MPKFDWTQVKGYRDDMSAEERMALLDAEDAMPDAVPTVSKAMFDKTASELADVKKQLRAKQTEDEAKAAEDAAKRAQIEEEITMLRREKTLSTHKSAFLSLGYDEKMAQTAAEALTDGKTDDVFAVMRQYHDGAEKALRTKILNETPVPPAGDGKVSGDDAAWREAFGLPPKK